MAAEFENILEHRKRAIRHADKKCRKRKMGGVPYNSELKTLTVVIDLWDAVVKKKAGV